MVWDFVFTRILCMSYLVLLVIFLAQPGMDVPLIESYIVLDKEEDLIGQIGRPQRSSEVNVF